jgi:hypothetical protein
MSAGIFLDLENNAIQSAGNTYGTAVSASGGLTAVDCVNMVGNRMTALLTSSAVAGSGNVTVKIQESTDDSTYTDITGATFTALTAANVTQIKSFNVIKQYVRGYATLNSGTSVTLQLQFLGQRRVTPISTGGFSTSSAPST